jgi:hypothetical protein
MGMVLPVMRTDRSEIGKRFVRNVSDRHGAFPQFFDDQPRYPRVILQCSRVPRAEQGNSAILGEIASQPRLRGAAGRLVEGQGEKLARMPPLLRAILQC